jgi:uncharacterized protein (DUF1800 family)
LSAADRDLQAAIAVTRFGLGGKAGEIATARSDPQGFLRAQIRPSGADRPRTNGETSAQRIAAFREFQGLRAEAKAGEDPDARDPVKIAQRMLRTDTGTDFLGRIALAASTDAGFRERWTLFWANHFTVSATKLAAATTVGPFEMEAVRPHVFGRFADLLVAVETHPAMLLYLDQVQSIGPNSPAAQFLRRRPRQGARLTGLNENLAREILELHTVGIGGGYSQADVTELARALTGVSIGGYRDAEDVVGTPVFRAVAHEPGPRRIMGVTYAAGGQDQAAAILSDLAAHPATARFVCGKIARHFVADQPPPALVARLEAAWLSSGGRLDKVAEALIAAPEAWAPRPAKFKTPYEFLVSSWRAAGSAPRDIAGLAQTLNGMGQRPFSAPSPKGWPEETGAWAAPDAIVKRMQWAQGFAELAIGDRNPSELAAQALGACLTPAAAKAIARAESRSEGFALLLMSPEFQRR